MTSGIEFSELLDYSAGETDRWKQWFSQNSDTLDFAVDIAGAGTLRQLLVHVFLVELHFANVLIGSSVDFKQTQQKMETGQVKTVDDLFGISEEATRKYRQYLARATPDDLAAKVDFGSRFSMKPSKRKLITQAVTHSMRHWAQISTFLRQQGRKPDWVHDFLMSSAME